MIAPALRTADYLGHMLDAIDRIRRYTSGIDFAGFKSQSHIQDLPAMELQATALLDALRRA